MVERVKSHRRAVKDETGKTTEIEYAVKAENIIDAGDLQETAQVVSSGEAVMVNVDGTLRRTTLAALLLWLQNNIQSGISFNIPYVDATTKHWMSYNPATGAYEDTGVVGEGMDGEDGKSAYGYAADGGYAGTEDEFKALMADAASKTYVSDAIQAAMLKVVSGALGAAEVSLDGEVGISGSPVSKKFTGTAERVGTIGTDDLVLVNASLTFAPSGETINTVMVSLPAWYVAPDGTWSELSTYEQMKVTIGTESYSLSPKDTATPRTYYTGDSNMDVFAGFTGNITVTVTGYVRVKRQTSAG